MILCTLHKFTSFHEHSNGDIYEIQGRLKDVQVMILKSSVEIDFAIMKTNKGNIVLGRDFLRAMKGFIDIGKGKYVCVVRQKVRTSSLGRTRMSLLKTLLKSLVNLPMILENFDLFCFKPS